MRTKLLVFIFFVFSQVILAKSDVQFLSPVPNSKYVKVSSSIILRLNSLPDKSYLKKDLIQVTGSKSGLHECNVTLGTDGTTIIFSPVTNFQFDEKVEVKINSIKTKSDYSEVINYYFETEKENILPASVNVFENEFSGNDNFKFKTSAPFINKKSIDLPSDFPVVNVNKSVNPGPGYVFISNFSLAPMNTGYYLMILDNSGSPVFYKKLDTAAYDFKKQPNGNLTYFSGKALKFYEMNTYYQIIDSFACGNGYSTDLHDLRVYPNGHSLLMSYDPQRVNMAELTPRGDPNAIVIGLVIQELDENKNVIFQWRSWDHFNILDATHENFTLPVIDCVHGNSIEMCKDGNILISSRHLDEVTKINRNTGSIIWRLGGIRNQFRFENETVTFSHQHAVRELPNGNITLFDNGNYPSTIVPIHEQVPLSRAVEYKINETTKIATLVWQYSQGIFGFAMGYAERLPNGNTIIGWGMGSPSVTEVDPNGEKVFEMTLPDGQVSYRALKDSWDPLPNNGVPATYKVYQNYPNPFNPNTTIRYDLPDQSDVKITVFNMLGQNVQEVVKTNQTPGIYEYVFNGSGLTSGVYFYRIKTNTFTDTKRMVLVK
ncbi:MAG: aryl-sulfate sulfotransferase [Bacteroidetes bacterium]|nr:aryl-sulfate sulfotransferase [Bacteroidota bacterium]